MKKFITAVMMGAMLLTFLAAGCQQKQEEKKAESAPAEKPAPKHVPIAC